MCKVSSCDFFEFFGAVDITKKSALPIRPVFTCFYCWATLDLEFFYLMRTKSRVLKDDAGQPISQSSDIPFMFPLETCINSFTKELQKLETSSFICSPNQWTGFYMTETCVMKELMDSNSLFINSNIAPAWFL